jgi:hypothetical protein
MQIDLNLGSLAAINDIPAATFFIWQSHEGPIFGLAAKYDEPCGVMFSRGVRKGDLYPCIVSHRFFQGAPLAPISDAYVLPDLSPESLTRDTSGAEGPGELILAANKIFLRVAKPQEGFFYVDVSTGDVMASRPGSDAIYISRWSIARLGRDARAIQLFRFSGPEITKS